MSDKEQENIRLIIKDLDDLCEDIATINTHKSIINAAILSLQEVENSYIDIEQINNKYVLKRLNIIHYLTRYARVYLSNEVQKLEITITHEENELQKKMNYQGN